MSGVDEKELEAGIKKLIDAYEKVKGSKLSERDIQSGLVEPLLKLLGWGTGDFEQCERETYLPTRGYVDITLKIEGKQTLFVECKRLEMIPKSAERKGDRTPEEKQAMRYAHGQKMPYAVLTNFERLHVFNADREVLILAFDSPAEYLSRLDELISLSREKVANRSLEACERRLEKHDVDLQFLDDLKRWREKLAQSILNYNPGNPAILDKKKQLNFSALLRIVQRVFDRLILIAYADEKALIGKQGKIDIILTYYDRLSDYAAKNPRWVQEEFNKLCHLMDDEHNTTIFAKDDDCEKVTVDNDTLVAIMKEIELTSFRKFTWDVLGNTYESYLGHKLELVRGKIVSEVRKDLRKGKGIYYTPPKVVKYIVQQTLGAKLNQLYQKYGIEAIKHVKDIKVVDPACGSGTFLIAAFETLADFYRRMNEEIDAETRKIRETKRGDMYEQQENARHLPRKVLDPARRILQENIYGVDLDPEAAEYAAVNLIMRAFEHRGNGNRLPLILNHNIKVGNSLVAGVHPDNLLEEEKKHISELIALRRKMESLTNSEKKKGWKEIERFTKKTAYAANQTIMNKYPKLYYNTFNWQVEFPEVFFNDDGTPKENPGFDVVIGNPPYLRQESLGDFKEFLKEHFKIFNGKADLYVYFFERGIDILKQGGIFGFISSNKFVRSDYGGSLRDFIAAKAPVIEIVDFGELPIFHDASPFPAIFILEKTDAPPKKLQFTPIRNKDFEDVTAEVKQHSQTLTREAVSGTSWSLASDEEITILKKMESIGTPLGEYLKSQGTHIRRGVVTGLNEAFIIDRATRDALIKEDPESEEIIKPLIIGDDVRRYKINYRDQYLIFTRHGTDINTYPAVKKHLSNFKEDLKPKKKETDKLGRKPGDYKWWEIQDTTEYWQDFQKPKIVYPEISMGRRFAFDRESLFPIKTVFCFSLDNCALLGLLNSRLVHLYLASICSILGDAEVRGRLLMQEIYIERLPVPVLEGKKSQPLTEKAIKITQLKDQTDEALHMFQKHVNNYSPQYVSFDPSYWLADVYSPLMKKNVVIDSDYEGEVTRIGIREEGDRLLISAEIDEVSKDVVSVEIADEDFRLFLYYSIRTFLDANANKRKWGEGKVAQIVLKSIQIPFFLPKALYDHHLNLQQIKLLIKEFRSEAPILHITEAEDEIARLEKEIDQIVYELYGLTEEEIAVVESKVL